MTGRSKVDGEGKKARAPGAKDSGKERLHFVFSTMRVEEKKKRDQQVCHGVLEHACPETSEICE